MAYFQRGILEGKSHSDAKIEVGSNLILEDANAIQNCKVAIEIKLPDAKTGDICHLGLDKSEALTLISDIAKNLNDPTSQLK